MPRSRTSSGPDAIRLAEMAGLVLDAWQQHVLIGALGEDKTGRRTAFEVGLVCPRQNGKGSILEALELHALFMPDEGAPPPLIIHSAHEFRTSSEHFRRMQTLIERAPSLKRQVRIVRTGAGTEAIELKSGARLRFATRTGGSGRGFSADLVVIDEAYKLTSEQMAALLPTLAARPNPQVWYTSSAGMETSEQLTRVRNRGLAGGDPNLAFFEWSARDDADLDDRREWARANPALGSRIPWGIVEAERASLPDVQFGRERLGLWPEPPGSRGAFDAGVWASLADPSAERGRAAFGVAVAPDRSWSAVAAAWKRPDGAVQVSSIDYRPGASWLPDRLADLTTRWGGGVVVDTRARGACPTAEEPGEVAQAAAEAHLHDLVDAGRLRHGGEPELNTAVRGAMWRKAGASRRLESSGSIDVSPLRAAALAVHRIDSGADALSQIW